MGMTLNVAGRVFGLALGCGVVGGGLLGCVSQQQYDELNAANQALESRLAETSGDLDAARGVADRRQATIVDLQGQLAQLRGATDDAVSDVSAEYERLQERYRALLERVNTMRVGGALDAETEAALRQLASENPALFAFDAENGVVRVASDLTFGSGSAEVRESVRGAIGELAGVLAGVIGARYDLRVEGHTDSQRMSNQATVRRFGDNRGLSLARARSVSEALQAGGVAGERILVAGWGPHRPLVANNARGGTAENRRVEIFVVPARAAAFGGTGDGGAAGGFEESGGAEEPRRSVPLK